MISVPLFTLNPHPCSYLDDQTARTTFVNPAYPMTSDIYAQLLAKGFRRSGNDVYTPNCAHCAACQSVRIPVNQFKPNRSQSRCFSKHQATQAVLKAAVFEQAHFELYQKYQRYKHPDSSMQHASAEEYLRFLGSDWCDTLFIEFKIGQQLLGVTVIDQFDNALSAVYTFYDPDYEKLSPGVYAVLWQIVYAKQLQLDWVYLGYWIANCQKMRYKSQYQPLEIYQNDSWHAFLAT